MVQVETHAHCDVGGRTWPTRAVRRPGFPSKRRRRRSIACSPQRSTFALSRLIRAPASCWCSRTTFVRRSDRVRPYSLDGRTGEPAPYQHVGRESAAPVRPDPVHQVWGKLGPAQRGDTSQSPAVERLRGFSKHALSANGASPSALRCLRRSEKRRRLGRRQFNPRGLAFQVILD